MSRILKALKQIDARTLETLVISNDADVRVNETRLDKTMVISATPTIGIGDTLAAISDDVALASVENEPPPVCDNPPPEQFEPAEIAADIEDPSRPDHSPDAESTGHIEQSTGQEATPLPPPKSPVEMIEELSKLLNINRPPRPVTEQPPVPIQAAQPLPPAASTALAPPPDAGDSAATSHRPKSRRDAARSPRTDFENVVAQNLKSSVLAGQYHKVATAIASTTPPQLPSSLNFVAIDPRGAATGAIAHLGVVLAGQGLGEVVIVDCDVHTRSLTRQFKKQNDNGVAEILEKHSDWRRSIVPTSFDHLDFLPAGQMEVNQVSRVAPGLAPLIHDLKTDYKFVLVDVGDAHKTMSQALGRYCDLTYLLIELGSTDIRQARKTAEKLRSTGSRIVGVVVLEPTCRFAG